MDHFTINRVLPIKTILTHFRNYLSIVITNKIITIISNPLIITTDMATIINFHLQKNYDITLPSIINNYNLAVNLYRIIHNSTIVSFTIITNTEHLTKLIFFGH